MGMALFMQQAVREAVSKIYNQPDYQPHYEPQPGDRRQTGNEENTETHTEKRNNRIQRHLKTARPVRLCYTQDYHSEANKDECEESGRDLVDESQ